MLAVARSDEADYNVMSSGADISIVGLRAEYSVESHYDKRLAPIDGIGREKPAWRIARAYF